MIPIEIEEDVRRLELMLNTPTGFHSGACARDLQQLGDITSPGYGFSLRRKEPETVVKIIHMFPEERVCFEERLGTSLPAHKAIYLVDKHCKGYDFQI